MKRLLLYYSFVVTCILTVGGFLSAESFPQLASAFLFYPITIFFLLKILTRQHKAPEIVKVGSKKEDAEEEIVELKKENPTEINDKERRAFIKLIGSAGLSLFMLAIFTKKAQAAFFGSGGGPGIVALKDTNGATINPAQKQPTDGYTISELDDSSTPSYYGFVDKDGKWYIMKEESSGSYRYVAGTSSFSTNWGNRASLTYVYFDAAFD